MLSKDELDDFYKVAFTPYTEEEFAEYSKDRLIKSYLEITHAHNFELISLVRQWRDYFEGRGEKPTRKLWVLLRPGKNNDNAACSRLVEIANSFSAFEHGSTPYIPIIPLCIRSSISLVNFLDDFYFSPHILEANHHIKEFFTLIAYQGEPQMTKEAFAQQLHAEINAFIHECSCYADALGEYMFARVKEMEKPASAKPLLVQIVKPETPAPKKAAKHRASPNGRGRHTAFMDEQISTLRSYLRTYTVTLSHTKFERAHQCWLLHRKEWDKAAQEKTGYSSYRSLANAL